MPLLLCPNCNTSMQTVSRSGVELDMCPSCRGVWMDRGELEKVLGAVREDIEDRGQPRKPPERESDAFRRHPEDGVRRYSDDDGRRRQGWDDDRVPKKKRGFDIFDIFD